jgi:DKNYY family protein
MPEAALAPVRIARSTRRILAMGLLSFLFGCGDDEYSAKKGGPWQQKEGAWHYRELPIEGADAKSFEVLNDNYAKDKGNVYFGDTYRKGQEYYTVKHSRLRVLKDVDPATFRCLDYDYSRDKTSVFYEGVRFPVKDIETFELIDREYARDRTTAYFHRRPIPGSDGSTFTLIDGGYSKDARRIFYSGLDPSGKDPDHATLVKGARPESFKVLGAGYAADAAQVYYRGAPLTKEVASFQLVGGGYAKTATRVYFYGKSIPGADPATFTTLEKDTGTADARDRNQTYRYGEKSQAQ